MNAIELNKAIAKATKAGKTEEVARLTAELELLNAKPEWVIEAEACVGAAKRMSPSTDVADTQLEIVGTTSRIPATKADGTPIDFVGGKLTGNFKTKHNGTVSILIEALVGAVEATGKNVPLWIGEAGKWLFNPAILISIKGYNVTAKV